MKMIKTGRRKNKWIVIGVLLLISVLLFWGCGGSGDAEEPQGEQPAQGEEVTPEPEEETPVEEPEEAEEPEAENEISEEELSDLFTGGREMDEFYYEMKVTGMGEEDYTTKMYMKSGLMRMESEIMGQSAIMIYTEDAFYTLDPQTMTAIKMPTEMNEEEERDVPTLEDFTADVDESSMNYLGKETINGITCHVVESREIASDYQVKMWLHEEYGFPMRVETRMENDEVYVSEVTDFKVGDLSDDLFEVPEGYQIVDLDSMIPTAP